MNTLDQFDVVVVGGGPGGVGAAVRAAQSGARTLLVERMGFLGGAGTAMMVNPFMPATTVKTTPEKPRVLLNGGLVVEIADRLKQRNAGGFMPSGCTAFDDEALKIVLDEIVAAAGAKGLYHATLFDTQVSGGRVQSIRLAHNGGPITVTGKVFVDSTGDGLLSAQAKAEVKQGNERGEVMPMTLFFVVGGVDRDRMPRGEMKELCRQGAPELINTNFSCMHFGGPGLLYINAIRVPGNTLNPFDLSHAETDGRRRVENFVGWLRARVPGFENCWLAKTAPHVGIRESRRVVGDYVLTGDDFDRCAKFDDAVACCAYPVDIHGQKQGQTTIQHLLPGEYYQIPYRCLTPKGLTNLLVASRCISCDVKMHSSMRCMATIYNLGEAAGYAAALSLPAADVRLINVPALQQKIRATGGCLEPRPFQPTWPDAMK